MYGGLNNGTPVSRRSGRRIRHRQTGDPALQFSKALGSTTIAITGSEDNERLAPELGGKRSGHSQRSYWPFAHEARRRGYHSFPPTADPPYLRPCRDSAPMVVWLSWTWQTRPSPYQPRLIGDAPPIGSIQNDRNTLYEALALVAIRNLTDQSGGMGAHEPRFPPLGFRRTLSMSTFLRLCMPSAGNSQGTNTNTKTNWRNPPRKTFAAIPTASDGFNGIPEKIIAAVGGQCPDLRYFGTNGNK